MKPSILVIGGGPSGLMAAISAARAGASVTLLEKGQKLGRKLAISGGGRCNVTNRLPLEEIVRHIPGNGRFLYSPFAIFNNEDIIAFFEGLGVPLQEEDHGRMFPVSGRALDVVEALEGELARLQVAVRRQCRVADLLFEGSNARGARLEGGEELVADAVIVATGGKAVPQTGSTGDGYPWAERAGHTVTELYPTEVPLLSNEPFIRSKELQGLALRDAAVSVLNGKGKPIVTHRMDMLFTHFGVSGPAILRCSQYVVKEQRKNGGQPVVLSIASRPDDSAETLVQALVQRAADEPKKAAKNAWKLYAPERWLLFLLGRCAIDPAQDAGTVARSKLRALAAALTGFSMEVCGTQPLEKAFVTGGGVSIKEIDPRTMGSRKAGGLFFCGEVLDIHGYTGGYNITAALVTGFAAGRAAAKQA